MKVNPHTFFAFCANHVALLRGLSQREGELSEAEVFRLIRANARFDRFANPDLLARAASQALLPKLRTANTPEVQTVLDLIQRHNAGLEQEALFL